MAPKVLGYTNGSICLTRVLNRSISQQFDFHAEHVAAVGFLLAFVGTRFLQVSEDVEKRRSFTSSLEAVTFSRYSFHLPELHELTFSRRCLGAVVDELPGKVKQAEPLTVADVKRSHWVLEHGEV